MSTLHILQTILEFGVLGFIVWGIFHEDKLVAFEKKIVKLFKK